jgi:hypothetical protein
MGFQPVTTPSTASDTRVTNARKRGIPLLPADGLHDFKITEADIDAAASATKTMP